MLFFFIFRWPNLFLSPVFYAVYAIRFMYKLYKNKLILLAALLQVSLFMFISKYFIIKTYIFVYR